MTTFEKVDDIVSGVDRKLHKKIRAALLKIALGILQEDPSTEGYPVRRKWAERVLRDPSFAEHRARIEMAMVKTVRDRYDADDHTDAAVEAVLSAALWRLIAETL